MSPTPGRTESWYGGHVPLVSGKKGQTAAIVAIVSMVFLLVLLIVGLALAGQLNEGGAFITSLLLLIGTTIPSLIAAGASVRASADIRNGVLIESVAKVVEPNFKLAEQHREEIAEAVRAVLVAEAEQVAKLAAEQAGAVRTRLDAKNRTIEDAILEGGEAQHEQTRDVVRDNVQMTRQHAEHEQTRNDARGEVT